MKTSWIHSLIFSASIAAASALPALAQAPGGEPSTTCRLFPLACPGPTPSPPPPLLGTPEEQVQAAEPSAEHAVKHRRHTRKRTPKSAAQ